MSETEAPVEVTPQTITEWLEGFGSPEMKILVHREEPKIWKGVPCEGQVGTHSEPINEDRIAELYGGHKYLLKVMGPNPKMKGRFGYLGARRVYIAGEPKLPAERFPSRSENGFVPHGPVAAPAETESVTMHAMTLQKETADAERARAERAERAAREAMQNAGQLSAEAIDRLVQPYKEQNVQLSKQLEDMKSEFASLRSEFLNAQKPKETTRDVVDVFGKLVNDGDSRLAAIKEAHNTELRAQRERHESELARLRETNERDKQRLEDRHKDDLQAHIRNHEAEIRRLEKAHENEKKMLETSFQSKEEVLKGRISQLERDLTKADAEIGTLRAIKEKSPIETLREAAEFKDTIADLTGQNDKDDEGGSGIIGQIGELVGPLIGAAAHRVQNAQPQPPPQQMRRRRVMRVPAQPPAQPGAPQPPPQAGVPQPPAPAAQAQQIVLDPADVEKAILFMEGAVRNGADPIVFAMSAQAMVPANIVQALKSYGVERFLVEVARVPETSPLLSVAGKKFIRKVTQVLVQGVEAAQLQPQQEASAPAPVAASPETPEPAAT